MIKICLCFIQLFYCILVIADQEDSKKFCPASSLINTAVDGIFTYPIDVFDPKLYQSYLAKKSIIPASQVYSCTAREKDETKVHVCSTAVACPVKKYHVMKSMQSKEDWGWKHSLCKARDAMETSGTFSKIIIAGGSVTRGSVSEGCCCSSEVDKKCDKVSDEAIKACENPSPQCPWPKFLKTWLNSYGNTQLFHLTGSGHTSLINANELEASWQSTGIGELTSADIVLIDHSVNDGVACDYDPHRQNLQLGLEGIILEFISRSKEGSWPTIIVLEHWPFPGDTMTNNFPPIENRTYDYDITYRKVTAKYLLPMISFRDFAWSLNKPEEETYRDYMLFLMNQHAGGFIHPPWINHLFYADIIASALHHEFSQCNDPNKLVLHARTPSQMDITKFASKSLLKASPRCNDSAPVLLEIASKDLKASENEGVYTVSPEDSWPLASERGRNGWIDEDPPIDKSNSKYVSTLTFTFPKFDEKKGYIIFITQMKTFLNAGVVDVYLCGKLLATLDALWPDYEDYRFSLSDVYKFHYYPTTSGGDKYCNLGSKGKLEFKRYRNSPTTATVPNTKDQVILEEHEHLYKLSRGTQKFKLYFAKVCEMEK